MVGLSLAQKEGRVNGELKSLSRITKEKQEQSLKTIKFPNFYQRKIFKEKRLLE